MASVLGFIKRNYTSIYPPTPPKNKQALKFGILGAAAITPIALVTPALSHPDVVLEGIAARDVKRAAAFAKKHGVKRVFASYQELLDDPNIDAVYIPLPNGLHYEWTIKALTAGKHVLLEKPSGNSADETAKMFRLAREKNLILLEAFHYRFHPAVRTLRAIIESGLIGNVTGADAELAVPGVVFGKDDIRFNYALGGGATMDMGCYTIHSLRYVMGSEVAAIAKVAVNRHPTAPQIDRSLRAIFDMHSDVTSSIYCDLGMPKWGCGPWGRIMPRLPKASITVTGTEGEVCLDNFIAPSLWHSITVKHGGENKVVKAYTTEGLEGENHGEEWWTTYRFQLEAFVDKVRGREPKAWVDADDSIANMKVIEDLYDAAGLDPRPQSSYVA